jgi:small subunit ribosomal protein S17
MIGRVVSTKMNQTAVVLVESRKKHPLYQKTYASTKKYLVDDQKGVKLGDVVEFVKCRPISKMKHWQITKVVGQDFVAVETEGLKESANEAIAEVLPVEVEATEENTEKAETEEKAEKPKRARKAAK